MGEMADLLNDRIERGRSIVRRNATGKELVVDNIDLMYGNAYDEPEYTVLGDYDEYGDENMENMEEDQMDDQENTDMENEPKYPDIHVRLVGENGNAFAVMGRVSAALRSAHVPTAEINVFLDECTSGDYDHLLATCMKWVAVD